MPIWMSTHRHWTPYIPFLTKRNSMSKQNFLRKTPVWVMFWVEHGVHLVFHWHCRPITVLSRLARYCVFQFCRHLSSGHASGRIQRQFTSQATAFRIKYCFGRTGLPSEKSPQCRRPDIRGRNAHGNSSTALSSVTAQQEMKTHDIRSPTGVPLLRWA